MTHINIRHIIRLHNQRWKRKEIVAQTGVAPIILKSIIKQFIESKLSFADLKDLSDKDLEELFLKKDTPFSIKFDTLFSLFPTFDKELKKKGVTRKLLWEEYRQKHPDGFSPTQFNQYFKEWKARVVPVLRREYEAGDKMFVDFAGEKLKITDKQSGEATPVEVFVATLGGSQLTYVEAVMSQKKEDFIPACENALHYFGGVPAAIVTDNLKSAVTKYNRYEPTINQTFNDFAYHYNTTILPARAYKPNDKSLVEKAVDIVYTRIYAVLRNAVFYSLDELNRSIAIALEEHNNKTITGRDYSRRQRFNEVEKSALLSLPELRYEFKKQLFATVMNNSHVPLSIDKHYYSVPYQYIGKKVKLLFTRYNVEIFHHYDRIATHKRERTIYKYTTNTNHLPASHKAFSERSPDSFLSRAAEIHPDVKLFISHILNQNQHIEKSYRLCYGVLSFARKAGDERLTKACQRALEYGIYDYKIIRKILEKGLDLQEVEKEEPTQMPQHDNIRGNEYYK